MLVMSRNRQRRQRTSTTLDGMASEDSLDRDTSHLDADARLGVLCVFVLLHVETHL